MDNLCLVLQEIKATGHKVCDKLFVRTAEVRDSMANRWCFLKQVSQVATLRMGMETQAPTEGSSSSTRWPNVDREINMQGCVFHIRFNRTCNAYTHHETISHLDSVAADIVDNSNSNTLLALVAVTKALGEAAQQRLHDEDKREAVPDQSRMLLIPTMAFPFHPAYYVQAPTLRRRRRPAKSITYGI